MLFIIGLLIGAVVVIFALQNVTPITVTFLAWQIDGSLALMLLLALAAGLLISALISIPSMIRNEFKFSSLKKQNQKLENELVTHKQLLTETQTKLVEEKPVIFEKREEFTIIDNKEDRIF